MPPLPRCSICGTTDQLLRCSSCKTAYYCSPTHQHLDWPVHKQECRQLAKQKNGMRMQQLQQAIAATTLSNSATLIAAAAANDNQLHGQQQPPRTHDGQAISAPMAAGGDTLGASATATLPHLSVILGTNENESLHSRAEDVLQNSNGGGDDYFGSFGTNTMARMQTLVDADAGGGDELESNSYYAVAATTPLPQQQYTHAGNILLPQQGQFTLQQQQLLLQQQLPQQQTQLMPPPQPLMQQQRGSNHQHQHQFTLSNHTQNQIEKSSSYQIGHSDENAIGNVNERRYEELCRNIINDMNQYGLSVVDDFLGTEKGLQILSEVHRMYAAGVFKDGQLVNNMLPEEDLRTIRGDKITWVKGVEAGCANVGYLINQIDAVICRANTMRNNGKLGNYNIKERTKAMVACYPGSGSHYIMHVDNPNKDGRVITAIYYLNLNWDTKNSGGVLRIFPEHGNTVADIEPKFDRLIFFWSDKRNPHEVQPAHRTRYAITVWYFDANEREAALNRCKYENTDKTNTTNADSSSNATPAKRQAPPNATAKTNHLTASTATLTASSNANITNATVTAAAAANVNNMKMNLNNKMANTKTQATNQICT